MRGMMIFTSTDLQGDDLDNYLKMIRKKTDKDLDNLEKDRLVGTSVMMKKTIIEDG